MSSFLFQEISPRGKRRLEFQQAPLKGQTFYLDLQGYRKVHSLQARIKELGGVRVRDLIQSCSVFSWWSSPDIDCLSWLFHNLYLEYRWMLRKLILQPYFGTLELSRPGGLPPSDYKAAVKLWVYKSTCMKCYTCNKKNRQVHPKHLSHNRCYNVWAL